MRFFRIVFSSQLIFIASLFSCGQAARGTDSSPPSLATIIERLSSAEHLLRNVEIRHFELTQETLAPGSNIWQKTNLRLYGDAWYNGARDSKARVKVTRVTKWKNGLAPWAEMQMDLSYDGNVGRLINIRGGPLGKMADAPTAQLLPEAPVYLRDRYQGFADGTAFSLNFYQEEGMGEPLSEILKMDINLKPADGGWNVTWDDLYGGRTLRLQRSDPGFLLVTYWLDPERGYAIRKLEAKSSKNAGQEWSILEINEIPDLKQAAPGIWFPIRATRIEPTGGSPGSMTRFNFHAENVIANNADFDEGVFSPPFPAHYRVQDALHGGGTFYTRNVDKLAQDIDNAVATLKSASDDTGAKKTGIARAVGPVSGEGSSSSASGRFTSIWICVAIIGGVLAVLGAWSIRRFPPSMPMFLLVCLFLTTTGSNAQTQIGTDVAESNCAVNTAYFCLKWFGKAVGIRAVARELDVGDLYLRRCSLSDIATLCQQYGLHTVGLKGDELSDVLAAITPGSVAIVRVSELVNHADLGHFVIVMQLNDKTVLIDSPRSPVFMSKIETAANPTLSRVTGELLLVSIPMYKAVRTGPAILFSSTDIDLGHIPIGTNDFVGSFKYANIGTEPVKILDTRLSCSCMDPPNGDFDIQPGSSGVINLPFHRQRVPAGLNKRTILLITNDPEHATIRVIFEFDLTDVSKPKEINLVPQEIQTGREPARSLFGQTTDFSLSIPVSNREEFQRIKISPQASTANIKLVQMNSIYEEYPTKEVDSSQSAGAMLSDSSDAAKTRAVGIFKFQMRWDAPPPIGEINQEVLFLISGNQFGAHELSVPIRGEVILDN